MRTILVTGANGFIGGYLCRHLVEAGYHVRGTVRRTTAGESDKVEYRSSGEIHGTTVWDSLLQGVDAVVHTAAMRGSKGTLEEFRRVNGAGTERLAREAAAAGARRFVFLSTLGVRAVETGRSDQVCSRFSPYQLSKWETERALMQVASETGLEIVILRPPSVYGWPLRGNFRMLHNVVARGLPLPFAGIENRRSIVYVGNLVSAIQACLTHCRAAGGLFEVSDGPAVSTQEFVRRLAAALGLSPRFFPCPRAALRAAGFLLGRAKDVESLLGSLIADEAGLRLRLNWRPPYSLDDALAETIALTRSNL